MGLILTALLIVLGMMFSAVLLAVIAVIVVIGGGYLGWKTRALRRQLREHQQAMGSAANDAHAFKDTDFKGEIIEGEVIRKVVCIEKIEQ